MRLSKETLTHVQAAADLGDAVVVHLPNPAVFQLPEKVLQFGTGVFIRGLIDYFIDKANNAGIFNGRIVMVKSTDAGDIRDLTEQDCLYTLLMKSVDDTGEIDEKVICAAVSRVFDATKEWGRVLACAANPDLKVLISNTTEVGIVLVENDRIDADPPASFPEKLLAFLLQRYKFFNGTRESGFVILPTELIPGNGTLLKEIINELAHRNKLPLGFIEWMNTANEFCNTLVDRIVPGKLPVAEQQQLESELGYEDRGMIMAESFGLWAIETDNPSTRERLSFSKAHPGIHIVPDISTFRELKLRLLNGSHNLSCALGYLSGFTTVKEAMADETFDQYMRELILEDIAAAIIGTAGITAGDAHTFGTSVLDRYRNPYIGFEWLSICVQDTSKIRIRAVPIVLQHHAKHGYVGDRISLGFAAYILFMRSVKVQDRYVGTSQGREYVIVDDHAADLHEKWTSFGGEELVKSVLEDHRLWGVDLYALDGFGKKVWNNLNSLMKKLLVLILAVGVFVAKGQVNMKITKHYLNIPIGRQARMKLIELRVDGKLKREIPVQLAEDSIGYWIYVDVSEFKGQKVSLSGPAKESALKRIYQDDSINGADSLYKESNRPQFHFTVKRGWSNDINGPIWYDGQYHLFWQSFPYGLMWNTGFMDWGHAVSKDLLHWEELDPALRPDSLGSPWSGTAVIDNNNDGGWGKGALVLYYACFDRISDQEVQCIAYSTDGGKTFRHYSGNPIINSDWELGSTSTRDPKVFWYEAGKIWVMVLFEKDGMSFFNSTDMRNWKRVSHLQGLWECPDFFELPLDGDPAHKKWVLHGGSSEYFIGSFDGRTFQPETGKLSYAEGRSPRRGELLYASQSFENMPDGRRIQVAWGRIDHGGMPFTQMILFPTEFQLKTTPQGIRLQAKPIREIGNLHGAEHTWTQLSAAQANRELAALKPGPLHVKLKFSLADGNILRLRYQGNELLELSSKEMKAGDNELEILLDKTVAELFLNDGERYIVRQLNGGRNGKGLEFDGVEYGPAIDSLQVFEMKSIW